MSSLIYPVRLAGLVDCKNLLMKVLNHAPLISGVSYEGLTMRYGLIATLLKDFEFINRHGIEAYSNAHSKKDVEGIIRVKKLYDAAFKEMGYITFDDQVSMAVELLKEHPGILETVQNQYDYIMVDEVQDLDDAQAEFVKLLVKEPENNLMICGDADQSIYAFRGGSNRFMLNFPNIYPGTKDILLSRNYRSSEEIVTMASGLIERIRSGYQCSWQHLFPRGYRQSTYQISMTAGLGCLLRKYMEKDMRIRILQ